MKLERLLTHWKAEPSIGANITSWNTIPARKPEYCPFPEEINPLLVNNLKAIGIPDLYAHQHEAWKKVKSGSNVVIATGTASGKSVCYNLPVLDRLLTEENAHALYLFPTKALARDQLSKIVEILGEPDHAIDLADKDYAQFRQQHPTPSSLQSRPILPAVYDGDTPTRQRKVIRRRCRLLISNPDMLHLGLLPHHTDWSLFFQSLRFVILDEIHIYRGVFGSHVANVIRRLKRIARFYGSSPQFILTSATIANPIEFAEKLIEEPVSLIEKDTSKRGLKHFLIYNPPFLDQTLGIRRSSLLESVRLSEDLIEYDVQTIIFGRSRRSIELILKYLKDRISGRRIIDQYSETSEELFRGYRSGYLQQERRAIEFGLRKGEVRAVVATNALELGIDIGALDAALLVGYPGSIASTWQQAGRSGRGDRSSLALLIASASPLDQFIAHHPEYLFRRSPEEALINPNNPLILLSHLQCAAFEIPFSSGESYGNLSAETTQELLELLMQSNLVHRSGRQYYWMADHYPAESVSLRTSSLHRVALQVPSGETLQTLGEVDYESATWMVHPHAVYLHESQSFEVIELDLEKKRAILRPAGLDYYTLPNSDTIVELLELSKQVEVAGGKKSFGEIRVTTRVTGFKRVKWYTHELIDAETLDLPPSDLITAGYWLTLNDDAVEILRSQRLWTNDPNQYGANWKNQRARARARDLYRCQICGAPEIDREHDVHHRIPFRSFASPEEANQLSNLVTLCPACHHRAELAVQLQSGLAGLAYVIGHLAPIYLMCDQRDIGVHSDSRSAFNNQKPTVLIFDKIPAGIGLSERLFDLHTELINGSRDLLSRCDCSQGCPSCSGPPGELGLGGKRETLALLDVLASNQDL